MHDAMTFLLFIVVFPLLAVGLELILLAFAGPDTPRRRPRDEKP